MVRDKIFAAVSTPSAPVGQAEFLTAGTFSWTAPEGVTSVCAVAVGGVAVAAGVNQEAAGAAVVVLGGETTLVLHPVHHILLLLELVGLLVQRVEQRVELADKATFYQLPQPVDLVAQVAQLPLAAQAAVVLELAVVTVAQGD